VLLGFLTEVEVFCIMSELSTPKTCEVLTDEFRISYNRCSEPRVIAICSPLLACVGQEVSNTDRRMLRTSNI
jgi:hypothetical protein